MDRALIYSLAICAVSIALESACAGKGIKQRLAEVRVPPFAPPLSVWIVIGAIYYLIFFLILYRLFASPPASARDWSLVLVLTIMLINALWNYVFFRTRNLLHAWLIGLPYSLMALALFLLLLRFDRPATLCLLPYLGYLFYANWFGFRVWKLNP